MNVWFLFCGLIPEDDISGINAYSCHMLRETFVLGDVLVTLTLSVRESLSENDSSSITPSRIAQFLLKFGRV